MARVPAISATDLRAAHEFPGKLMKVTKAGPGVQPHRNQEDRPGHKAGKQSSTAQRLTLHSSVGGAASHGSKPLAMPEASSTAIIIAGGCASRRRSQRRCLAWPCRCGDSSWMRSTLAKPTEGAPRAGPRRDEFRCHTRGHAFGIGWSVMTSPLLEISPSPIGLSTPLTGPDLGRH
jgi:hypothetical protein